MPIWRENRHGESGVEGLSQVQAAYMEEMGPSTVIKRAREAPAACLHQQLLKQKSGRLDTLKRQAVLI
jgi:uncharacterized membrane protein YcaP (DUF421 family)